MGSFVLVLDILVLLAFYIYVGAVVVSLDSKLAKLRNSLWRHHSIFSPLVMLLVLLVWPLRSLGHKVLQRHVDRVKNTKPF